VVSALTTAARAYAEDYRRDDVTVLAVMRDPETAATSPHIGPQATVSLDDLVGRERKV
jgi:hypothetical protein